MKTFYPLLFFLLLKVSVDAATFIVTDTTASSPFSFAQAIADANALPGKDTIEFDIPGTLIRKIISDSLPDITDTVFVDGYSQPGNTSFPGILTLLGTRGLTIRTAGCKITVLNIQYSGFANIGISLIADSGKSISNTILSRCEMIDFPIGIKIFPSSPNSLNSANILIDSVWVDGGNGTIAFELTTTPTSDIAYVAISNCMFNSYSCPGGCYAGTACLVNRQNNSVLNPHYSFSRCRTIGELNFQGYLDSIYVGHCNMTGGCGYLIFENCSVNNALIEYNTISGGAAGCGTSAVTLGFSNFLNDTTRNIHVQNNEISGGDIDFDFSGNGQEVDSIFYENNRSAGNIYFQKLNVGNVDTQIVSNIFIRNNSSLGLGGITINLSFSG